MGYMGHWLEIFKDKNINSNQNEKLDLIPIVEDNFTHGLNGNTTSKFMTQKGKLAI